MISIILVLGIPVAAFVALKMSVDSKRKAEVRAEEARVFRPDATLVHALRVNCPVQVWKALTKIANNEKYICRDPESAQSEPLFFGPLADRIAHVAMEESGQGGGSNDVLEKCPVRNTTCVLHDREFEMPGDPSIELLGRVGKVDVIVGHDEGALSSFTRTSQPFVAGFQATVELKMNPASADGIAAIEITEGTIAVDYRVRLSVSGSRTDLLGSRKNVSLQSYALRDVLVGRSARRFVVAYTNDKWKEETMVAVGNGTASWSGTIIPSTLTWRGRAIQKADITETVVRQLALSSRAELVTSRYATPSRLADWIYAGCVSEAGLVTLQADFPGLWELLIKRNDELNSDNRYEGSPGRIVRASSDDFARAQIPDIEPSEDDRRTSDRLIAAGVLGREAIANLIQDWLSSRPKRGAANPSEFARHIGGR